jgi:hypothetical protein
MASAEWPFSDPENLATFTVEEIMSGERPVLYVRHDLDDGCWQFLTGEEVTTERARLVCLADVVSTDPTLLDLADLKLGWFAERDSATAPWSRKAEFPTEWNELVERAEEYTEECQARLKSEFSLSTWERYDYDQRKGELVFSTGGVPRLRTKIQIVGSTSTVSNTWLWSWDNPSILEGAAEYMHLLKTFGEQHEFERLSRARWPGDESDGWEMTCVACFLMQGEGVYRAPEEDGALFMILKEPELLGDPPAQS